MLGPYIEYATKYVDWLFLWLLGNGFVAMAAGVGWLSNRWTTGAVGRGRPIGSRRG